ncbi:MAG: cation transporter [Alphaproteobacteria bacterium]
MTRLQIGLMSAVVAALVVIVAASARVPLTLQSAKAQASETRTITFVVENMTCAACPITVRKAMRKVKGVISVDVDFEARTATVAFDPSLTNADAIAAASANAGYPAKISA